MTARIGRALAATAVAALDNALDLIFITGLAAIVTGVAMLSTPAAFVTGGLLAVGAVGLAERRRRPRGEK